MISVLAAFLLPISAASQFVPRFPYYTPQDFLLEYYAPAASPALSFSSDPYPAVFSSPPQFPSASRVFGDRQMVLRDLPMVPAQEKFSPFSRQPGVVPKMTGSFVRATTARPAMHSVSTFASSSSSEDRFAQPGAVPKFTGGFLKDREQPYSPRLPSPAQLNQFEDDEAETAAHRKEDAAVLNSFQGPVTNPAAHFLSGTHFEKISTPKCRMLNCAGPVPNDGSLSTTPTLSGKRSACSQVLVPINGCVGGNGYPMAMLCSVCCECTAPLVSELLKSAGNFRARA